MLGGYLPTEVTNTVRQVAKVRLILKLRRVVWMKAAGQSESPLTIKAKLTMIKIVRKVHTMARKRVRRRESMSMKNTKWIMIKSKKRRNRTIFH